MPPRSSRRSRFAAAAAGLLVLGGLAGAAAGGRSRIDYLFDLLRGAGGGTPRPSGSTVLADPAGIWSGPAGLYFTDRRSYVVYRLEEDRLHPIAGTGRAGFTGDGRQANRSRLNMPAGLAGDREGNLFVADSQNHRIRRIARDGSITTVAGNGRAGFSGDGGAATQATLDRPQDVAVGPSGALFVADWGNHRIRRVAPDGLITTVAGNGEAGFAGDGGPARRASLNEPYGLDVDALGAVFIADSGNHRIRKIATDGTITTLAGNGRAGFAGDRGPAREASFDSPQEVLVTGDEILIVDEHNHRVRKILPSGVVVTLAGNGKAGFCGDGGPATEACLNDPEGVAVDGSGVVYVTDGDNGRVRRIDPQGSIETLAGSALVTPG